MKPWYRSRTLWVGFVLVAAGLAEYVSGADFATDETSLSVAAAGALQVILRAVTKNPVSWRK